METMENIKEVVEVVASEEVKEAAVQAAEEIVAENSGSVLKTIGKAGVGLACVAGVAYAGWRFVAKPLIKKFKKDQEIIDAIDAEFEEDEFADEYDDFNDPQCSEENE